MSVPVARPVSTPVLLSMATAGVEWVHVPPGLVSVSVVVNPTHTVSEPPIAAGNGLTVTGRLIKQPVPNEYVTVAVPPGPEPVNNPVEDTIEAIPPGDTLHVPPADASVSVTDEPEHTADGPPMANGSGLTVTGLVVKQLVPSV